MVEFVVVTVVPVEIYRKGNRAPGLTKDIGCWVEMRGCTAFEFTERDRILESGGNQDVKPVPLLATDAVRNAAHLYMGHEAR